MSQFAVLEDCVFSDRGGIIENVHRIHAAVTDACGSLLYAVGDPSRLTLARSAANPAQILALLEIEGFEQFAFDDMEIALMCSSHSSEERHVQSGVTMLAKIAAKEQDLRCGGHPSMSESVNNEWIRRGFTPGALCNNCSAKHMGMLAGAKALGQDEEYHLPDHQVQIRVRHAFEELTGLGADEIKWGIDGSRPPLRDISYLYALLAHAADAEAQGPTTDLRTRHLARIYHSMWRFPGMVAGDARFCTELMLKHGGNLVGKLGANGCYGVAIRDSEETRHLGANSGLGISVKGENGNEEILYAVVMEILEQLGIGSAESRAGMEAFHHIERVNTAGVITGKVSFSFKLRKP
ncbi:L-asparaginase II [Colletotrichum acutatum]|uniref:L-asparaginase II n=1 Tax=Glomerella acutata TaxID=27357 RepID=A0AAD8XIJ0_GLOAC|nr:L-asparaginase II [Colletotrichum acutatum]KAK1727771.1 L-asparaginase II [Colletotrichum acutatum]